MTRNKEVATTYKLWEKLLYFFPVQLLFVHFKKNIVLLLYWIMLFGIVTKSVALKYGIPYLFLYPEYLEKVNFTSHLIIGILTGAFIMAYNLSSYVVNGFRFPFLATLHRPFIKYCQNNTLLPITYTVIYIVGLVQFQSNYEHLDKLSIAMNVLGFVFGNILFILLTTLYFISTNKNADDYSTKLKPEIIISPIKGLFGNQIKWESEQLRHSKEWKVVSYISDYGRIAVARNSSHYKKATLEKVFHQNRVNATVFQLIIFGALFIMGLYYENEWLMIPAAGSILLFFTMMIMLTSAFYSWFKGWASVALLVLFFGFNFFSTKNLVLFENQAYGLNYDTTKAVYSQEKILELQENSQNLYLDVENGLTLLQNWKEKTGSKKPTAVFLNVPGGGLRSSLWTMQCINYANEIMKEHLWDDIIMVSGSSGGMIGAAYLREFYYRKKYENDSLSFDQAKEKISKDKLNSVASSAVLNDLFFRFKTFTYDEHTYVKDRALAFERKLNEDTDFWLDRKLWDYHELELKSKMPMMLLAPTISNDGRKLLISSQPISYLCFNRDSNQMNENLEFTRFFENQNSKELSFVSALRMSATFPYVFPAANMPTEPSVQILDAGIRDNYGMSNTLKFIYFFKDWLKDNTEKIIIIQVRDKPKFEEENLVQRQSLVQEITQPFGTFYSTFLDVQDYLMDDQIRMAGDWYGGQIEVIDFVLDRSETNPISLSWHLTKNETQRIEDAVYTLENQEAFHRLKKLVTQNQQAR